MFADLSGSTRLYETLGDARAKQLVIAALERMSNKVKTYEGRIIKTIGDELLCLFNTSYEAVIAARHMVQEAANVQSTIDPGSLQLLRLRIGLHFGPVIEEGGDVFGDSVNTAARMVSLAKPNTIVASDTVQQSLPPSFHPYLKFHNTVVVKGKLKPIDVYEITTATVDLDQTMNMERALERTMEMATLVLRVPSLGTTLEVSRLKLTATVGRGKHNDISLQSGLVSREHARIDYKHGKFYVTDFSNNGTYLELADGTRTLIKKSDCRLILSGKIFFGEEPGPQAKNVAEYDVRGGGL